MGASAVRTLADGPPPGHTGGFNEPTCTACHQPPASSRSPSLAIAGLPATFEAGRTYDIEVVSRATGLTRAGFQLSARFEPGSALAGRQAGVFSASLDPQRVAFTPDTTLSVVYAHHTLEGTLVRPSGPGRWLIRWTAPAEPYGVVFHAASVIASDDNSPLDDEVVTASLGIRPGIPPGP